MLRNKPILSFMLLCLLMIAIEGLFSFCGKRKCPAFTNPTFDLWFPYDTTYHKQFASSTETDSLRISSTYRTAAYETSGGFESRPCGASASVYGMTKSKLNFGLYAHDNGSFGVELNFANFYIASATLTDSGFGNSNDYSKFQSKYYSSTTLGSTNFSKVQSLEVDTLNNKPIVYKIWIAQGKGLIGYQKRIGNSLFVLQ